MATLDMCAYVFDTLHNHFHRTPVAPPQFSNHSYPLFVTFHKESKGNDEPILRGCKGTFTAREIHEGLAEFSLISALKDTRFAPVTVAELPKLHCSVSLLTDFELASHVHDWELGRHGIILDFEHHGRSLSATYLPEVAPEQEWDKIETIKSLARKAGYNGPVTEAALQAMNVRLTRYQSSQTKMTYAEYLRHKASRSP